MNRNLPPRILVGTLHTNENEYAACVESIVNQQQVAVEHFVISGRPNKQAHDELYETFMSRSADFDFFAKVDADMVLARPSFFSTAAARFRDNPDVNGIVVPVQDWYTSRLINGLHIYRSNAVWAKHDDPIFVDPRPANCPAYITDFAGLTPAAYHCPNPSGFQAFHFGVHKGVKALEGHSRGYTCAFRTHVENIELLWLNYLKLKDRRLLLASLGAELALRRGMGPDEINWNNHRLHAIYADYTTLSTRKLASLVRWYRNLNGGMFGPSYRSDYLSDGLLTALGRAALPRAIKETAKSFGLDKLLKQVRSR